MNEYWQQVLEEVTRKKSVASCFTHLSCVDNYQAALDLSKKRKWVPGRRYARNLQRMKRGPKSQAVYLGEQYADIYFTAREAHCGLLLLKGLTMRGIAEELGLSPRTIEYYVDNMKTKMRCRRKSELISSLFASDFLKNLHQITDDAKQANKK